MTWQRINDNTYIDETLVTCAEYQLFIDEMREQEKYYQPDHWISSQFPSGKSMEPILGVRYLDAVAFCEWLTKREDGEWRYRLLSIDEIRVFLLKPLHLTPLGYWINGKFKFAWTNPVSTDARRIDQQISEKYFPLPRDLDPSVIHWVRARRGPLPIPLQNNNDELDMDQCIKFSQDITSSLSQDITNNLGLSQDLATDVFLDNNFVKKYIEELMHNRYISKYRRNVHLLEHILDRSIVDRAKILPNAVDQIQDLLMDNGFISRFVNVYDIFRDLFTLQERIAGRSPAFEGIRLVKERTR